MHAGPCKRQLSEDLRIRLLSEVNQKLDVRPFRHGFFTCSKPPVAAAEGAGIRSLRLDESRFGTKKNGQFGVNMTTIGQNSYYMYMIYVCIYYSDHEYVCLIFPLCRWKSLLRSQWSLQPMKAWGKLRLSVQDLVVPCEAI